MYKNLLQNDYNKKIGLEKSDHFYLRGKPQIVKKADTKKKWTKFFYKNKSYIFCDINNWPTFGNQNTHGTSWEIFLIF